ncbi:MAG: DUF5916 domain-containing protein [Flavobacteriaceae bacterium]
MTHSSKVALLLIMACLIMSFGFAQNPVPRKTYTTKHMTQNAPEIDGVLDDKVWNEVEWSGDFVEFEPNENTAPEYQSQFKIIYDDKFLYVAFRAFDSEPEKIVQRLSRRDGFVGDRANILFDSYNDQRTGFMFTVTATGVKGDEIVTRNGDNFDDSWNPIWYTNAVVDDKGWTAEMKIPFSQLRFGKEAKQNWGLNFGRQNFRLNEFSLWQRIPADAAGFVSESGVLTGLNDLEPQKQKEVQPFVVSQLDNYPAEAGNPFRDGKDFGLNAGLDAKIGVTNDLTLDLTVNPDFGQVEADPAQIALDGFEIFFKEQRPFFVENKSIFDFNFGGESDNLFYSRRIGRSPQGYPDSSGFVDQPISTAILGAAKFSGKTQSGWSIGLLESLTRPEFAQVQDGNERSEVEVEPLTNYAVARVQKDFNNDNSFVGGMFTAVNRGDLPVNLDGLHTSAYSGGLDFQHQWQNREYAVEGKFVFSHVFGSKEAILNTQLSQVHLFQRPDADHLSVDPTRTSLTGTGGRFSFNKRGGGNFGYSIGFHFRSPEIELNDIGFLRQTDFVRQYVSLRYKILKPIGRFRTISTRFLQFSSFDFQGNYNRMEYRLNNEIGLFNNWNFELGLFHKPRILETTTLRGGPIWRFSEENAISFDVKSDERKRLSGFGGIFYAQANENNFSMKRFQVGLTYQPMDALTIAFSPEYSIRPNKTQYVTETAFNGTPRYIMASIDNNTLSASLRVNYTINPNLTVQYYGQPFVSNGNYSNFKYVTNSVADRLSDRYHIYDDAQIAFSGATNSYQVDEDRDGIDDFSFGKPDFSVVQFRSNLVLRWEYIPGSELFLVWSQGVSSSGDYNEGLAENLNGYWLAQKPSNTFLIKATYRFLL